MATYYDHTGRITIVEPADGKQFSEREIKAYVGGDYHQITVKNGRYICINQNQYTGMNYEASRLVNLNNALFDTAIFGDVLYVSAEEIGIVAVNTGEVNEKPKEN